MKGDGEDRGGFRDFLSLGRSSEREEELNLVSRDGLNMLAGGGFTLKPPPTSRSFGGFHRPNPTPTTTTTWPGMGMVFVNEESAATHAKLEQPLGADVASLTPGECWSVVLKLGKRWPAWNHRSTMTLPSPQGGVRSEDHERRMGGSNSEVMTLGQGSLDLLTSRALEALAQAPAGSMQAPKQTTQQFSKAKAALRDPPSQAAAAIPRQPAKPPTHSPRVMAAGRRTAPLTIFYDGKVNVCDNVPEDKAHLIMLFAERSSLCPPAEAPASSAGPSTSAAASPQVTPQAQATSSSSHPAAAAVVLSLSPGKHHHSELGSPSSHRQPPDSSNAPSRATTATTEANTSRLLMQQCLNGPMSKRLPNARKNSLARFLDSRKRPNASASEDPPPKKQESGPEHSDAADDSSSKPCSDSKERILSAMMYTNDAEK